MAVATKMNSLSEIKKSEENISDGVQRKHNHLKLVEAKRKSPSDYFYQVSNPSELAKIGDSFLVDFQNGIKSFAISSTNYKASQQRTCLALASYFDHLYDMNILIISDSLNKGVFTELLSVKTVENLAIPHTDKTVEINHFYHHFDLIDLNKLFKLSPTDKPTFDFEVTMQNLMKKYDVIFWDTPIINTYKNNTNVYNHIVSYFESLTIIVSQEVSSARDVNEIHKYFTGLGVNVKGVLFDKLELQAKSEKKKKWGIF